jgi:hypothetical protein
MEDTDMQIVTVPKSIVFDAAVPDRPAEGAAPEPPAPPVPFAFLAACGPREETVELRLPPPRRGMEPLAISAFTWVFYQACCWEPGKSTCRNTMHSAAQGLEALMLRLKTRAQTPMFAGETVNEVAIAPRPWSAAGASIPVRDATSPNPRLVVGYLAGVRDGMPFWRDAGTASKGDPGAPDVEVLRADWFDSLVRKAGRPAPLPTRVTRPSPHDR